MKDNHQDELRQLEELRVSHEQFLKTFMFSPYAKSIIYADNQTYIDVNNAWEKLTEYSREDALNNRMRPLTLWRTEDERIKYMAKLINTGYVEHVETKLVTKQGSQKDVKLSSVLIQTNNKNCIVTVIDDITENKKISKEMKRLHSLDLIGQMAGGIAHEVRNPMTTVKGFLQLFSEREKYAEEKEFFKLMIDEIDHANSIISEFLSLAQNKRVEKSEENLNIIIETIYPLLNVEALKTDKTIVLKLQELPLLLLNHKEIRQLIVNLVNNALEVTPSGGKIFIKTFIQDDVAVMAIKDQGCGIPQEILDNLGTPFLTTKDNGTGLGLSICYSIASRHGANIDVETSKKGTIFYVRFKVTNVLN